MKQELLGEIVGDENIRETVSVIVIERDTHSLAFHACNSRGGADIAKTAVAFIVKQQVRRALIPVGPAVGMYGCAAEDIVVEIVSQVSADKGIQFAIVIIIDETRRYRPAAPAYSGLARNIGKCSVAIVAVENVITVIRHIDIRKAVVIVIADRDTHSIAVLYG